MGQLKPTHAYDDIIHLPHPVSERHPPMTAADRAAQFAPFAALTGYDGVIRETARLTDTPLELDESRIEQLDRVLQRLRELLPRRPMAVFTCFQPDKRKKGGAVVTVKGVVKTIDPVENRIFFADGSGIFVENIYDIQIIGED